jgi:exodeoxyribonuclease V alpha subunit
MEIKLNKLTINRSIVITWHTPGDKGSQIIRGEDDTGKLYSVVANYNVLSRAVCVGESWQFWGEWDTNPKYHNQILAAHGEPVAVEGELLARYIAKHPRLNQGKRGSNAGEKTWLDAIEKAGDANQLATLLDNEDYDALIALGIGRLTVNLPSILVEWKILRGELEGVKLLAEHNVSKSLSRKLIKYYADKVPDLLSTDCYKLLAYDRNTKALFLSCQTLANRMGYAKDDKRRLQGAIDFVLNFRLDNYGHTAIKRETLITALVKIFEDESLAELAVNNALSEVTIQEAPNCLLQSSPVAHMEATLEQRFVEMIETETRFDRSLKVGLAEKAQAICSASKVLLVDEQIAAIQLPFHSRLSIVTGGAGTGKTTVISNAISLAKELGITVYQMALSGQAAGVMRSYNVENDIESLSRTIHWYVLPMEKQKEDENKADVLNAKDIEDETQPFEFSENCLIVIDECSMVDLSLMNRLIRILPKSARIVMVGDKNQIAPIGAGLVFHLLCSSKYMPMVTLTQVHRSAAETGIPAASMAVADGAIPNIPFLNLNEAMPMQGVYFLPTHVDKNDQYTLSRVLFQVAQGLGFQSTQVITTHRKGSNEFGHIVQSTAQINSYFQQQITHNKTAALKKWGLNESDPVLVRKNVSDVGGKGFSLFNGNIGTLVKASKPYRFKFNKHERELDDEDIAKLGIQLGYSLTVHSFQGSAQECVVIAVKGSKLLERSLLYTAITRAKRTVILVGDYNAFQEAVLSEPKWKTIKTSFDIDRYFKSTSTPQVIEKSQQLVT